MTNKVTSFDAYLAEKLKNPVFAKKFQKKIKTIRPTFRPAPLQKAN